MPRSKLRTYFSSISFRPRGSSSSSAHKGLPDNSSDQLPIPLEPTLPIEQSPFQAENLLKIDQSLAQDSRTPGLKKFTKYREVYSRLEDGTTCDIACFDARYNRYGDYKITPSTSPLNIFESDHPPGSEYALTWTRYFDQKGRHTKTKLKIRSPHLLQALEKVAAYYPGAPVITKRKVVYETPYRLLLHCYEDLDLYRQESEDDTAKLHLGLLLRVIRLEKGEELDDLTTFISTKKITFSLAWAIFRPGTIVFTELNGAPEKYSVHSTIYGEDNKGLHLRVTAGHIDFDGKEFRVRERNFQILEFNGVTDISSLPIYPFQFHQEKDTINQFLVERGHKWFEVHQNGPKIMNWSGVSECATRKGDLRKFTISGRLVIDNSMFNQINPTLAYPMGDSIRSRIIRTSFDHSGMDERTPINAKANMKLPDDDAALCTAFVRGYSLKNRLWGHFNLGLAQEVDWATDAFDRLILRESAKQAIKALVTSFDDTPSTKVIQDLVPGKGLGMVFLLHGPPGVGKTLTAETIAEYLKRPLYVVSGGELGATPDSVDARLSIVLEVATAWKAIVLIDEADVFLQERDLENLERNSLVSIFLRQLEYYEGLMFLTTNRVKCIDDAFQSRIDVALNYPDLTQPMRRQLWEDSLKSLDPTTVDIDLETALPKLADQEMNGRDIRKAIKAATLMSTFHQQKLTIENLFDLMGFRMFRSLPLEAEELDREPERARK